VARRSESERASSGRLALAGASILLALSLLLPLWVTRMEAPQYRDDEVLEVRVFAGRVAGDIHEINLLNQYVGVHLPLDTVELHASPWILGALLGLSLVAIFLPAPVRRRAGIALCALMVVVLAGGAGLLQYRLYQMGHERSPTIMTGVPDFTPPILGSKKIANFWAYMGLGAGGWAYLGAILLAGWSAWMSRAGQRADLRIPERPPRSDSPGNLAYSRLRSRR
jgi:hypothetical protein